MIVPSTGRYLWDWYFGLSERLVRARDGVPQPIPPTEFQAWREATGNIVYPSEYAILCAMDAAYCGELGKELADYQARRQEAAKQDAAKNAPRRRGRK